MENIYSELTICGSKKLCARTTSVFFHISEVSEGTVSLTRDGKTCIDMYGAIEH